MVMMKVVSVILLLTMMLVHSSEVNACTCIGYSSPCGAYASASLVFVGTVEKTDPDSKPGDELSYGAQQAHVRVEKAFKGCQVGDVIVLDQPGHGCAPKFRRGESLLLYVNYVKEHKTWEVFGCGRSTTVGHAGDDLRYLEALPQSMKRARISGVIEHYEDTPEDGFSLVRYLARTKVTIVGLGHSYEVKTDVNGVYEAYDLPAGRYTIRPEIPFGLKLRFPMAFTSNFDVSPDRKAVTVELPRDGCAGSDFVLSSDTEISGRILNTAGKPVPKVCVELRPVDGPVNRYFRIFDCPGKDGNYVLKEMPPGRYFIAINAFGRYEGATVYYPGVLEKEKASTVVVDAGARLKGFDVHLPTAGAIRK